MKRLFLFAAAAIALQGCAAGVGEYMHGTQQTITIESSPAAAVCVGRRAGEILFSTGRPGQAVTVSKSKNPIELDCMAPGYLPAHQVVESSRDSLSWSPLYDLATGAANIYPATVAVSLVRQ